MRTKLRANRGSVPTNSIQPLVNPFHKRAGKDIRNGDVQQEIISLYDFA
jgi:hypothetical protein